MRGPGKRFSRGSLGAVWLLHETHQVRGRREADFEAMLRDAWMPQLAELGGARLLAFLHHAHGTGTSYRVVTLTAVADGVAWQRLVEAVDAGPLARLSRELDDLRHDAVGKVLLPLPWSSVREIDLDRVPVRPVDHEPTVFMEDTVWPEAGKLERYVEAAGSHYAREMAQRESERQAILRIEGAYRTAFASGRRREVLLWQRVVNLKALGPLVSREVPERYKRPGTWMHDALSLRDQWESRLLRTARWSPLA